VRNGVDLFDPIRNHLYTEDGVFYQDGRQPRKDQATEKRHGEIWKKKVTKRGDFEIVEPEWELFVKCIRGQKNNLKTAWPQVRTKKMRIAFDNKGGPEWNDFINSIWGPEDDRQSVRKRYDFNRRLLDLRLQPDNILADMDSTINEALSEDNKMMVGAYFAKFCGKYRLVRLANQATSITQILASPY
jgi:hypothetical protein